MSGDVDFQPGITAKCRLLTRYGLALSGLPSTVLEILRRSQVSSMADSRLCRVRLNVKGESANLLVLSS